MDICSVNDCDKPHKAKGFCSTHHQIQYTKSKPSYTVWIAMNQRCYNKNNPWYHRYGGRGIKVCDRWRHSYKNFLEDVGVRPTTKHSLDRIDNDGDYEPTNIRWADQRQQTINTGIRKDNKLGLKGITFDESRKKYRTNVWADGRQIFLGRFDTVEEAIKARAKAVDKYY